jgi:hypothetical protein
VFKIRSDNNDGVTADQMRASMALVGVVPGCLRESSHYSITPDGLSIRYRVTDQEVFKYPPRPAFEATGFYRESAARGDAKRTCECKVRLKGDKATDQARLVVAAVSVVSSKLNINGAQLAGAPLDDLAILEGAYVEVDLYKNEVEAYMRAMTASNKTRLRGMKGIREAICFTPFSDGVPLELPAYELRGTTSLLLNAAAYYDPSFRTTVYSPENSQLTRGLEVGEAGRKAE